MTRDNMEIQFFKKGERGDPLALEEEYFHIQDVGFNLKASGRHVLLHRLVSDS